jgi:hypothetical protein
LHRGNGILRVGLAVSLFLIITAIIVLPVPISAATFVPPKSTCSKSTSTCTLIPTTAAYVVASNPTVNYGADTVLDVESVSSGGIVTPTELTYLEFNTSIIPKGMSITSGVLTMYLTGKSNVATGQVGVYVANGSSWGQLAIDWDNRPSYSNTPLAVNYTIPYIGQNYTWSIGTVFPQVSQNLTLVLASPASTGILSFDNINSLYYPYLDVNFGPASTAVPPSVSKVTVTPASPSSEDLVTVSANITDNAPLSSVAFSYSINGSSTVDELMQLTSGTSYTAVIQRQSSGSFVSFTVTATNAQSQEATSSGNYTVTRPAYYYQLLANYDSLEAELANLTESLPTLQAWKSFQASYAALQASYTSLQEGYNSLQTRYQDSQAMASNLSSDLSALSAKLNSVTGQVSGVDEALANWKLIAVITFVIAALVDGLIVYEKVLSPRLKRSRAQR